MMCAYDPNLKANSRDIPHPSQWKLAKLKMRLDNNPVMDDGERTFLLDALDGRIGASERAEAEKAVVSVLFNKKWVREEPILWLIHALVDNDEDEIKHAYLEHFDVLSGHMVIRSEHTRDKGGVLPVDGPSCLVGRTKGQKKGTTKKENRVQYLGK